MAQTFRHFLCALGASLLLAPAAVLAQVEVAAPADPAVRDLVEQNRQLQQKVDAQQRQIDELRDRLDRLPRDSGSSAAGPEPEPPARSLAVLADADHQVRISGETGLAFFSGGGDGAYPNSDFHVDESRIFVEAPVWHNVYFLGEMDLATRENDDDYFHIGELYVDMEDVLTAGRHEGLSLRVGRFNIPFGEEYQYRTVMTNPLITHSVTDIWGYDTGVQAYGSLGIFQYNLAVQNGGVDKNKAVTARVSVAPVKSLRLSASAHNTGKLNAVLDGTSQIWFGGAFFRSLVPLEPTNSFEASLFELDASWRWKDGHVNAAAGLVRYEDDNPAADDSRRMRYYSLEAVQKIAGNLSGAARFSEVHVPRGFPLMGEGNGGDYFYNPFAPLTTDLQRLSLGLGYQFGPPFVWKVEYSWERGRVAGGGTRDNEDLLSTEIGISF